MFAGYPADLDIPLACVTVSGSFN